MKYKEISVFTTEAGLDAVCARFSMLGMEQLEMYDALSGIVTGGFTERLWALDNRQLYKHGHE